MASKISKPSILKTVAQRSYSAQAAAQANTYTLPQKEPQVTTLSSGTVIASLENNAPVAKVAVLFKAGSRYETAANAGVSHVLRRSVGLATGKMSAFGIMRNSLQNGASLAVDSGRDHMMYSVDIIRDNVDFGLDLLKEVSLNAILKPWEISSLSTLLKLDLARKTDAIQAIENVHAAAFRTGLGNSLFVAPHRLGKISNADVKAFVDGTHGTGGMAIVGLGLDHDTLLKFAKGLSASGGVGSSSATVGGGELRTETGSSLAHVAVCGVGAGVNSPDALPLAIAQFALGTGSTIKYGGNASSKLAATVASAGGAGAASAINVNYADTGLFGYMVTADDDAAGSIVKAIHSAVKGTTLTDDDVASAKNKLKSHLAMSVESSDATLEDIGLQALLTGKYIKPGSLSVAVDSVSTAAVNAALKKVLGGKLSMGAAGGIHSVPYLDEL